MCKLAARMIEAGRPIFGICRGLQELDVLFCATLSNAGVGHYRKTGDATVYETVFDHVPYAALQIGGLLETARSSVIVTSMHRQGFNCLDTGFRANYSLL